MANYKPSLDNMIPLLLFIPTYSTVSGVEVKSYPSLENGILFYGSFKTYGGTERNIDGLFSILDTAVIETWFRPDIKSNCRIGVPATSAIYDVINEPENIGMRNQFLKFKVKRARGGA